MVSIFPFSLSSFGNGDAANRIGISVFVADSLKTDKCLKFYVKSVSNMLTKDKKYGKLK